MAIEPTANGMCQKLPINPTGEVPLVCYIYVLKLDLKFQLRTVRLSHCYHPDFIVVRRFVELLLHQE
jgi:hypothetical protein